MQSKKFLWAAILMFFIAIMLALFANAECWDKTDTLWMTGLTAASIADLEVSYGKIPYQNENRLIRWSMYDSAGNPTRLKAYAWQSGMNFMAVWLQHRYRDRMGYLFPSVFIAAHGFGVTWNLTDKYNQKVHTK